jgi:hypothetical protein
MGAQPLGDHVDTAQAFALGETNPGKELKVFDWERAARRIKESGTKNASAGLRDDWEWTGDAIFIDGKPNQESRAYLASTWATPELAIAGEVEPCFRMQSETPGWDSDTNWPQEALDILSAE